MKRILTFDVGTTAVKAYLWEDGLRPVAGWTGEYELLKDGLRTEQEALLYWEKLCEGARTVAAGVRVDAVCVTTQGETMIPVDPEGNPLSRALVWLDSRAEEQGKRLEQAFEPGEFYRHTGHAAPDGVTPLSKLLWFREEQPEVFAHTYKFLLLEDWLLYCLTGEMVTEKTLLTSTGYFDLETDDYWTQALELAGIPREKLPTILDSGQVVAPLTDKACRELGILSGGAAVTGAMDQTAGALGFGAAREGDVCVTIGTALTAAAVTRTPDLSHNARVTVYRHALPGHFLAIPFMKTAGILMKWFRDEFSRVPYEKLQEMARTVPPGSGGLLAYPYFEGEMPPMPCPQAAGAFFGVRLDMGQAHFVRALMEGVAYMLKDNLQALSQLGVAPRELSAAGGGARNALWLEIMADVTGLPLRRAAIEDTPSLGAALLAGVGLGLWGWDSLPDPQGRGQAYLPCPDNQQVYDGRYEAYTRLRLAAEELYGAGL